MNADKLFNVLGAIVTVAAITAVLSRGTQASRVVDSLGRAFTDSIRAATGQ